MNGETCACWSCDGQCGGTDDLTSCGNAGDTWRGPICDACASKADVFDDDRTGAQVTIAQNRVKLTVDVFDSYHKRSIYLDLEDVEALRSVLLEAAGRLSGARQDGAA